MAGEATNSDQLLAFTLPERNVRGRCVKLGPVIDTILAAHHYPPAIKSLLTEALILCALMGSLLKGSGQLTMQAHSEGGIVRLLVCDYRNGELRGYVDSDSEALVGHGANTSLKTLFGRDSAYLAVTFDLDSVGERYQGIVPLDRDTLSQACESYFHQSEQIPTLIRVAITGEGAHTTAGGMLLQHLPHGEEGGERLHVRYDDPDWEHIEILGASIKHSELVEPGIGLDTIVWRLFHEEAEIRVEPLGHLTRGCRCSDTHFADVLRKFGADELRDMKESDGKVHVDCAFCSRIFKIAV